jgi:glycosyltransferase involved in cell wall biosynthesis
VSGIESVSIIIPCYNSAKYLPRLAESLKDYQGKGAEILFVDDGSNDSSAELFQRLLPAAHCIRQENQGVAAARNTGVREARGEFVQLLDADDTIEPGKLEAQVAALDETMADVAYSDWRMILVVDERIEPEPIRHVTPPAVMDVALLGGWWVPVHSYLIRKSAYLDVGGSDASLCNAQDFDLMLRLAITGKVFTYVPVHSANYYRHVKSGSLARGSRRRYWSDTERVVEKGIHLLEERNNFSAEHRRAAAARLHSIARGVYEMDREWFHRLVDRIHIIAPEFHPPGERGYRLAARFLGLSGAERLASFMRSSHGKET